MKLTRKIKAIIVMAVIAIISITCVACVGGNSVEFKYKKDVPTTALYGTELYFKDYIPREYGKDYKLYATYHDNENDKDVTEQLHDSLVFKFENVGEHKFKIVRGEEDTLECTVTCMPEVPRFIQKGISSKKLGYKIDLNDMVFEAFGSNPLENKTMVECDPSYNIELTQVDIYSVEVDGADELNYDFKTKNQLVLDKDASYTFTFKATTVAGSATTQVTFSTSDTTAHSTTLNGYVLDEDLDNANKKGLYFTIPGMTAPANGDSIKVRFGPTADKNIYSAVYNEYTGKYFVADFAHEIAKGKEERLYVKETGTDGKNFSTYIATADIITQENADTLSKKSDGYILLGEDIEFATKGIYVDWTSDDKNVFSGTLDGNGKTIKNLEGTPVVSASGTRTAKGTSLFSHIDGAIIRNVAFEDAVGVSGIIVARTEGENLIENVVVKSKGYTGAYSSLIGFHVDSQLSTTIRNVVYNSAIDNKETSYQGMISAHAGGSCIVDNFIIIGGNDRLHANIGQHATYIPNHVNKDYDEVVKDRDYFRYNTAEEYAISGGKEKVSDFVNDMLDNVNLVVALDHTNIQRLSGATNGYYYLTEDIDMAGISMGYDANNGTSLTAQQFTGILDGKGYELFNFTAQAGYLGLFQWTRDGATIKNLDIHARTNTSKGVVIGQVKGATLIQNVNVVVDKLEATNGTLYASAISSVLQGTLTLKDVNVLVKDVDSILSANSGILATGEAGTKAMILDNVTAIDASRKLSTVCTSIGAVIKSGEPARYDITPLGIDGQVAVKGEDYSIYNADILEFDTTALDSDFKASVNETISAITASATTLTASNIDQLLTATSGYYFLGENIDFTGKTWSPNATFAGVFNGKGYKITNFTAQAGYLGLFQYTGSGAIIKNVDIHATTNTTKGAIIGQVRGETLIQNVNVTLDEMKGATHSSVICSVLQGQLTLKDVNVLLKLGVMGDTNGILCGSEASTVPTILDNVTAIDASGKLANVCTTQGSTITGTEERYDVTPLGVDGEVAVDGEDYFLYNEISKLGDMVYNGEFDTEVETMIKQSGVYIQLTEETFAQLQGATAGYYVLTEDVDMTKVDCNGAEEGLGTWTLSGTFAGTLNGNGHVIKSLSGSLFNYINGATIKNLAFVDAKPANQGVIAGQTIGKDTIENVVVNISGAGVTYTSIVGWQSNGSAELTVKDVVIFAPNMKGSSMGFIVAYGVDHVKLSNVHCIGSLGIVGSNNLANSHATVPTITKLDGTTNAVAEEDYFIYADAGSYYNSIKGSNVISTELSQMVNKTGIVTELTEENFAQLLTAESGYYILKEDIDMTKVDMNGDKVVDGNDVWAPVDATIFKGILDGNGKKITNFTPCGTNYIGLFARGNGAIVKNITIDFVNTPARAGVFGRSQGTGVNFENVTLSFVAASSYNGVAFVGIVGGPISIKDSSVVFKTKTNTAPYLVSPESGAGKTTVSNLTIIDLSASNVVLAPEKGSSNAAMGLYGTDGLVAVAGEDYTLVSKKPLELYEARVSNELNSTVLGLIDAYNLLDGIEVVELTEENFAQLSTATSGYYILTEDIDMTGISFAPSDVTVFTGTLNGNGKKITNFTPCGANWVGLFARGDGATIKNLTIHYTKSAARAGLFGRVQGSGTTVVENCNIIVDTINTAYGTTIANAISGQLIVRDTLVYIKDSSNANVDNSGALGSKEASTKKMIVDNVVIVDAKGKFTKLIPDANNTYDLIPAGVGGSNAVNGTDYFLYSSVSAVETARQGKTLPDGFETRLVDVGVLTAASNG